MGLFELGILPYYLHLLDKVSGAEHFLVSDEIIRLFYPIATTARSSKSLVRLLVCQPLMCMHQMARWLILSWERLISKLLPYYLHLLDKVSGAEHFLVSDEDARRLHRALQKQLSGYLVPRLVRDENLAAKTWV
jgi:L-lysine 2,3-aminomutase